MSAHNSIGIKGAAAIQFAAKYSTLFVQVIITAILARLLTPGEFGAVAIITVFIAFFTMISDVGIGTAVIQFDTLDENDYRGLFSFSFILGFVLMGLFCLLSNPLAYFYQDESIGVLCLAASPSLLFSSLNMVPNGLMLKRKLFLSVGVRLIVVTVISGLIGIISAFIGLGPYALILQSVSSSLFIFLWNFIRMPGKGWNIHFGSALKKVYSYSLFQFGFSLINYFNRSLANLLIGRFLGTEALGYYDKAYKLTTYPLSSLSGVISSVLQPFMAEYQNMEEVMFRYFIRIERFVSLVGVPIVALLFCCSNEIIVIVYGDNWIESVAPFQFLVLSLYIQFLGNPTGAFYQSLGRTDLLFQQGVINSLIMIAGLVTGLMLGSVSSVALGVSIAFIAQAIPMIHLMVKVAFHEKIGCLIQFFPEIIIGFVAILAASFAGQAVPYDSVFLCFAIKSIVVGVVIALCYWKKGLFGVIRKCLKGGVRNEDQRAC